MPQTPGMPDNNEAKLAAIRAEREQLQNQVDRPKPPAAVSVAPQAEQIWWTTQNAMTVSTVILVFGALVLAIAAFLIRRERDAQVVLKVLATILIITFSVFLIVAGWSDQQIGPAMGLLGTIAGYLLGKDVRPSADPDRKQS